MVGKTAMVWQIRRWGTTIAAMVKNAVDLGLDGVSLKIVDRDLERWEGLLAPKQNADFLPELVPALRAANVKVKAWGYTGRLGATHGAKEGAAAARACLKYGIEEFDVDAESEYEHEGLGVQAKAYMQALRSGAPNLRITLCSFRYPTVHRTFPWIEFLADIQLHTPQVYFLEATAVNGGAVQLAESMRQLSILKQIAFAPVAPTYVHKTRQGDVWMATGPQLTAFFQKAKDAHCEGVSIWCLDGASAEQMAALKAFQWHVEAPAIPSVPENAYLQFLDAWARAHGYTGPRPA